MEPRNVCAPSKATSANNKRNSVRTCFINFRLMFEIEIQRIRKQDREKRQSRTASRILTGAGKRQVHASRPSLICGDHFHWNLNGYLRAARQLRSNRDRAVHQPDSFLHADQTQTSAFHCCFKVKAHAGVANREMNLTRRSPELHGEVL